MQQHKLKRPNANRIVKEYRPKLTKIYKQISQNSVHINRATNKMSRFIAGKKSIRSDSKDWETLKELRGKVELLTEKGQDLYDEFEDEYKDMLGELKDENIIQTTAASYVKNLKKFDKNVKSNIADMKRHLSKIKRRVNDKSAKEPKLKSKLNTEFNEVKRMLASIEKYIRVMKPRIPKPNRNDDSPYWVVPVNAVSSSQHVLEYVRLKVQSQSKQISNKMEDLYDAT